MSFLGFHKRKIGINHINDEFRKGSEYSTKEYINASFSQSPLYKIVNIEGEDVETRIIDDKNYKDGSPYESKVMLLRPNTVLVNGSYIYFKNKTTGKEETWLLMFYESHPIYPKSYIRYCNKTLKYGEKEYPCVITSRVETFGQINENKQLVLPNGYLLVYLKATADTLNTKENDRFLIDGNAYEVQTIDITSRTENKIGIVQMNLKRVPKNNEENNIISKDEEIDNKIEIEEKKITENNRNRWEW